VKVVRPLHKGMTADRNRPLHVSMAGAVGHDHSAARPHHFDAPRARGSVDNRSAAVGPNHRGMARWREVRGTAVRTMELGAGTPAGAVRTETPAGVVVRDRASAGVVVRTEAPAGIIVRDRAPAGVFVGTETPTGIVVRGGAPAGIIVRETTPAGGVVRKIAPAGVA